LPERQGVAWYVTWPANAPVMTDFSYEATVEKVSGGDSRMFGLMFRLTQAPGESRPTYYLFGITAEGAYELFLVRPAGDGSDDLFGLSTGESRAINRGDGGVNRLQVVAAGDLITFSVNGTPLGYAQDRSVRAGRIGLFGEQRVHVAFSDLQVTQAPSPIPGVVLVPGS
jgi:hypothetical protein